MAYKVCDPVGYLTGNNFKIPDVDKGKYMIREKDGSYHIDNEKKIFLLR